MGEKIVIGIGGSGARCVEAFLHLASFAAPSSDIINVGLIDQDMSHGNLGRASSLLGELSRLRAILRPPGGGGLSDQSALLRADLRALGSSDGKWAPFPDNDPSLRNHFRFELMRPELGALLDVLFNRQHLDLNLSQGFRGLPHIGAAAMLSAVTRSILGAGAFWTEIAQAVARGTPSDPTRVFICGSVFGGTGAAGLPAVATYIRQLAQGEATVQIGGGLLLPYFTYKVPPNASDEPRAEPNEFLQQTAHALRYYRELASKSRIPAYDEQFVIGWDPLLEVPYLDDGGPTQSNLPLVPEFLVGLTALDFVTKPVVKTGTLFASARERKTTFGWNDLPVQMSDDTRRSASSDTARDAWRRRIGGFLRLSLAFHYAFRPSLEAGTILRQHIDNELWYIRHLEALGIQLNEDARVTKLAASGKAGLPTQVLLDRIDKWMSDFLIWFAGLSFGSTAGGASFSMKLADVRMFAEPGEPGELPRLKSVTDVDMKGLVELLSDGRKASFHTILERLTYDDSLFAGGHRGISHFVAALHGASEI